MITMTEFELALEDGTMRSKMVNAVRHDFPRMPRAIAEEVVQASLMAVWRDLKMGKLINTSVEVAVMQEAKLNAINHNEKDLNRRRAQKGYAKQVSRMYDSTRQIDFKIDLSRAIEKCVKRTDLQAGCILVLYAGCEQPEIAESLGLGERQTENWLRYLKWALQDVRKEMRRKGYRRMVV